MPVLDSNEITSTAEYARKVLPPAMGTTVPNDERILVVDSCALDHSIKCTRPYLIAVMDSATRLILATAIAKESEMAAFVCAAVKEAIATDPETLQGVPIECDFCDPAELHASLDTTRIVPGHRGRRARGWAERQVRAAALMARARK